MTKTKKRDRERKGHDKKHDVKHIKNAEILAMQIMSLDEKRSERMNELKEEFINKDV